MTPRVKILFASFLLLLPIAIAHAQKVESKDRDRGQIMLDRIKDELKKNYYDPTFRGMDLDVRFKTASDKIKEATSVGQIFGIIAQVLIELNDTHTYFLPPGRVVDTDYGWTMMMVGDRCYVSSVGDQVLIWKMTDFDLTDAQVDDAMSRAKKHKTLILDLRGNRGGWITTINRLVSNLFDRDVKIGESKYRKETKPQIAKSRGEKSFDGKLIILVDSRSASASEVLARTIQLEKRGVRCRRSHRRRRHGFKNVRPPGRH